MKVSEQQQRMKSDRRASTARTLNRDEAMKVRYGGWV